MKTLLLNLIVMGTVVAPVPLVADSLFAPTMVSSNTTDGAFPLVAGEAVAPLWADASDWPGVLRAVQDLQADVERVTGQKPALRETSAVDADTAVLIGTLGRSPLIDGLVAAGKLDASPIAGRWEAFTIQVVEQPRPGLERALVIAGSDKRGTIYGIYELSQQIGVSPWYWWADVTPRHQDELYVAREGLIETGPTVKYRGIFLNDEYPALTKWVAAKFGQVTTEANPNAPSGVANYGREFYTRIFEVMLRMRGNYLWPAMWNNAFNEDDPANARLADEYGIVMGTSHQEPMMRAQKEWDWRYRSTLGHWNYGQHPEVLERFWREGIRRNKDYENLVTMGLRGADDTEMAPGGPEANRALLEHIVDVQRDILREEVNADITQVPQVWTLYKEVQEFYEHGMRVPDDVTLLWAEDNWGNLRRLPTAAERDRAGGAGVYYHFDYHGGPRSYQWLNTNPIPKIWEQMSLAAKYEADRVWIVNVGHFKGYELPMEFFINLAWDPSRWTAENLEAFTVAWATREFGSAHAAEIADIVAAYTKFNGRRKPELQRPDTFSLTHYREAETVVAEWQALVARSAAVAAQLPAEIHDAYYALVDFPVRASALLNEIYHAAGRNALFTEQGRASAREQAEETRALFARFQALMDHFNHEFLDGKWAHFMDQAVLGYTSWRDPPENSLKHLTLVEPAVPLDGALGIAVEGQTAALTSDACLPTFDALNRQRSYLDVFNRGREPVNFTVRADAPWIKLSATEGRLGPDTRIWVEIDWSQVPAGESSGTVIVAGGRREVAIAVTAVNPADVTRETLRGFAEGRGYVAMEAEHASRVRNAGANHWERIPDYGRTLSGMRTTGPVDAPSATPGPNTTDSPVLEYDLYLTTTGPVEVIAITAPTLNFVPDRGLRYAVSIDDEAPQIVTLVEQGYQAQNYNAAWEKSVADNAHYGRSSHTVTKAGYHTLKIWMVDPAVVMQKLVVDLGGLKPSYLGPPESYRGAGAGASASAAISKAPWELSAAERDELYRRTAEDHADMMRQLGITKLRPGRNPNPGSDNPPNYDPALANPWPDWPELLVTEAGAPVTTAEQWWSERRPEIVADFEREVVGQVPADVPPVEWSVAHQVETTVAGLPVVARQVIGRVDSSAAPDRAVEIRMSVVLPAQAAGPVPVLVMLSWSDRMPDDPPLRFPGMVEPSAPPSADQLIAAGWGYVSLNTSSIQPDNGAGLTSGIIGLVNQGARRAPEQWGALRAWAWGASRAFDYLTTLPTVDAERIGIEGVSRYGKAALVAMAFDRRFAVGLIGSSGEGGAKPHRRDFGEAVENLAGPGGYHWMAGNFLKYAADVSRFGSRDAGDLPVDAHQLIALCAPRPVFISYGVPEKGDAHWLDQTGSFMATVAAGPAYRLLGAKDLGVAGDYRTAQLPPVETGLLDGALAWRQHAGGHEDRSNMSTFLTWARRQLELATVDS